MPLPSVPAGLPLRVVADWRAVPRTGALRRKALAALALAATLLVAAIPAFAWLMRSPTLQKDNAAPAVVIAGSATDRGTPAADGHREPVDETRVALVDQVRETYEPLVAATNESLAGVWNALPGANGSDHTASPRADESATLDDAVLDEDLAASIRPVATSATRSVAALLRVLPGSSRALDERGIANEVAPPGLGAVSPLDIRGGRRDRDVAHFLSAVRTRIDLRWHASCRPMPGCASRLRIWRAHLDAFRGGPLYRRLRAFPPLNQFLQDNAAAVTVLADELSHQTGLSADDVVRKILGRQLLVAVWPGAADNADQPGPALAIVECEDAAALSGVVTRLLQAERAAGRRVATTRWRHGDGACEIQRIETDEGQPAIYLAVADRLGIVATSESLVTRVLGLHVGDAGAPSLSARSNYRAGMERLNPRAVARVFIDPPSWGAVIDAHKSAVRDLPSGTGNWLAEEFGAADYLALSCELGERIMIEGFLHRRDAQLATTTRPQVSGNRLRLAERLPGDAVAAFAGKVDLARLLGAFFGERDAQARRSGEEPSSRPAIATHEHSALRALSALVADRGRDAVAALVPQARADAGPQEATGNAKAAPFGVDWVVGFDTHSLLPDDRLALDERVEPILRAGLTAAIMMYNRQGATMTIESAEEGGVPMTSVAGLALMGQGNTATFSLLQGYFWAGTSRDAVRDTARLDTAESLAANVHFQTLENPRVPHPSHLAYLDLAAVRQLLSPGPAGKRPAPAQQTARENDLRDVASLADRLLIELQIDSSGAAFSATIAADRAP